jgi:hypothetical protein
MPYQLFKKSLISLFSILILLVFPSLVLADPRSGSTDIDVNNVSISQLGDIIKRVIDALFGIAGAVIILIIIVGGVRYILSAGDPKAVQSAKGTITFAVIGLVIILLAVVIVNVIGNLLGASNLTVVRIGQ